MPDRYIPGVPCWVDTSQPDPAGAAAFYGELFGWELEDVMPPESPFSYHLARIRGENVAAVGSLPEGAPPEARWDTYVWVTDADATAAQVREAGGSVVTEPFDVLDAGRTAVFADPAGALLCAWQPREHRGATIVNEHGSVNFNNLHTRDVEAAHWSVTFAVDDADAIAARAPELGGRVVTGPFDAPWVRMAVIADPQGATFTASQFVPPSP